VKAETWAEHEYILKLLLLVCLLCSIFIILSRESDGGAFLDECTIRLENKKFYVLRGWPDGFGLPFTASTLITATNTVSSSSHIHRAA